MSKRIYVGNLPFNANDDEIRSLFEQYGTVETVHIVMDRETGRPRGFAFVEMSSGVDEAIRALHQTDLGRRSLNINEARPRTERGRGGRRHRHNW